MATSDRNFLTTDFRTTVIAAARTAFLLVGIVSTTIILASTAVPFSADLLSSALPRIRTLAFAWLSPSYLFITVHFIIIVIWKLHDHNMNYHPPAQNELEILFPQKPSEITGAIPPDPEPDPPDSNPDPPKSGGTDPDESHDTIDATWKAIVEKGAEKADSAAQPRMKKSDSWERYGRALEASPEVRLETRFRKSETFRRVSVGREELFGRAEAFIRTQYEQRRLQRQESVQRYFEMVNAAC
ncbi:uncharacterized protein LOC110037606 [Phalaenopsis equestris]|uniref:uncharacterized protein LOC110037606 n=1 Tax=Phalaenopsis equestris TaxID=78828 RepID=UPI0009E31B31|nr:uncharacterized protein LOC110037606 [Phalaenopsis equestris]